MINLKKIGLSVFCIIFDKTHNKYLILKRNGVKQEKYGFTWGFPGGHIEDGETSTQALVREINEETEIVLKENKLRQIFVAETPHDYDDYHSIYFFYYTFMDKKKNVIINSESLEFKWINIDEDIEEMFPLNKKIVNMLRKIINAEIHT